MRVSKLEDLEIYHEALRLAKEVYLFATPERFRKDYSLIDQMRRASISVAANIAEGYGRKTKADFGHFLTISLGSLNEVVAYLDFVKLTFNLDNLLLRSNYQTLARRIHAFRSYLQQQ